ncbi:MAG: sigma-70 family RNA polymerase sigma factor [Cyclobacteriaceae bacterium]
MMKIFTQKGDKSTVKRIKKGDTQAFKVLYDKYADKILHTALSLNLSQMDAEGVVQEVFLRIWKNRSSLDESLSINSYLLTIAKSYILKNLRRKTYQQAFENYSFLNGVTSSNQVEDYIIFSDMESISRGVIDELPKQQRQVFMMKTQEHLSIEEISNKLEISQRTTENHFFRATKTIKDKLIKLQAIS